MTSATYFDRADAASLISAYPLDDRFLDKYGDIERSALEEIQQRRFLRCVARAWQIPFYQRLWGDAGIEPGDIGGLEDLPALPTFSKSDLMASVESHPPFGDYHGAEVAGTGVPLGVVFQTTSGTTGQPQPLFCGPRSRELQALLLARAYRLQGISGGDVVHSVYGHGTINGGHYIREAFLHFTNALLIPAGTGLETRSKRQVALMRQFGVTVLVGFPDYLRKLGEVASDLGLEPGPDIPVRLLCGHFGQVDRESLSRLWGGASTHDWYGVGDTGLIAAEIDGSGGLVVMEDAQLLEICDPMSGQAVSAGQPGNMVVTCLYKDDVYPIIRFNTMDMSAWCETAMPSRGLRRIQGFLGRSDNMAKIKGINIYPEAIGSMLRAVDGYAGEFVLIRSRVRNGSEDYMLKVEIAGETGASVHAAAVAAVEAGTGVRLRVEVVAPGTLVELTGIESRQKPRRLVDE